MSSTHTVDDLRLKTTLETVPKGHEGEKVRSETQVLVELKIEKLGPLDQRGFLIQFKVDVEGRYNLNIDMNYSSQFFTE